LFSVWARTVFPAARIHAYEPDPQWHDCLSKNADIFNFTCFPEAVGGHPGNAKMAAGMRVVEDGSSEIRMVSFDSCLERFEGGADLVKMDCEGAEWRFLNDRKAWENVEYLTMEYHLWPGKHSPVEVKDKIKALGFKIINIKPLSKYTGMLLALRK
jgi:FkbM family methyltransferase